ncbi:MAG: sll1863 family stress response protein [Paludibacteraceae bacterium]
MKKNLTKIGFAAIILAASTFTFTSCNKKAEKAETTDGDSIAVVEEVTTTTKDYSTYTFEQKNEVVADAKTELESINQKINELKADTKAKEKALSAESKANYEKAIKDIELARDEYKIKIDALEKSTADTWDAAKTDFANAYNTAAQTVENTYNDAKTAITGAIENAVSNINDSVQK